MKMQIKSIVFVIVGLTLCTHPDVSYAQSTPCRPIVLDAARIEQLRSTFVKKNPESKIAVAVLIHEADSLLGTKPLSVLDKTQIPPSGTKHDFLSIGPYWWPDTSKPDGLPYIRRDGRRNPEYHLFTDPDYFDRTVLAVEKLCVTFAITDDVRYSAKAAELLRVWFLDENTKMNPNMNHAQYIPGTNTGRGIGIIETRRIYKLLDALCLLGASHEWKKADDENMRTWLAEYYRWLTTSKYGIDESNEKNNHGTWYDVQVVSISMFLGKSDRAAKCLEEAKLKRIASQIEPDGKQPLELARTNSWGYSAMNLSAFFTLARLGDRAGVDLWKYQSPRGGSIRKALDYLLPYTKAPEKWEYQNLRSLEPYALFPVLLQAQGKFGPTLYSDWLKKIRGEKSDSMIDGLFD